MLLYIYIIVAILSITLETYKMQFNNKMRYRRACGFTLAEILITLMILGFVGAMGVPMLTQQRDKRPLDIIANHGTVECYYDEDGQLRAWVSNNSDDKDGHFDNDLIVETEYGMACKVTAPLANSYVIQAIGAGGMGAKGFTGTPEYKNATEHVSGDVSLAYNEFKNSIMSVETPNWVRKYWKDVWYEKNSSGNYTGKLNGNRVKYTVTGALNSGGKADCATYINKQISTCLEDPVTNSYPKKCYELYCGPGGDSGRALKLHVDTILNCNIDYGSDGEPKDVATISEIVFTPMYSMLSYAGHAFTIRDVDPNNATATENDFDLNKLEWQEKSMFLALGNRGSDGSLSQDQTGAKPGEIRGADGADQGITRNYDHSTNIYIPNSYFRFVSATSVSNADLKSYSGPFVYLYPTYNMYTARNPGATKANNTNNATGQIAAKAPEVAKVSLDPSSATKVSYRTDQLAIDATYGLAGVAGSVGLRILEKLPTDTEMLLIPAISNVGDDKDVVSRVYIKHGDTYMLVIQGTSGADGASITSYAQTGSHIPVGKGDLPFPAKYYPEAFKSKSPYYSIATTSGYHSALLNAFNNSGFVPGKSGAGIHPIVKKVEGDADYYLQFEGKAEFIVGDRHALDKLESDDETCFDKTIQATKNGDSIYCGQPNTPSNPGAVLLSW